jgi:hypothetical protein
MVWWSRADQHLEAKNQNGAVIAKGQGKMYSPKVKTTVATFSN